MVRVGSSALVSMNILTFRLLRVHRNLKKFHIRAKKDKAVAAEPTIEEQAPIESDPIMEEREDVNESKDVHIEEGRVNDERSPPADTQEEEQKVVSEPTDVDAGKDSLPVVAEEPLKEESNVKPADNVPRDLARSMDEDMTLDADTATFHDEGCQSPAHIPAFCGCFAA